MCSSSSPFAEPLVAIDNADNILEPVTIVTADAIDELLWVEAAVPEGLNPTGDRYCSPILSVPDS